MSKLYRAVLEGCPARKEGQIDAPIDRAPDSIILRWVSPEGKPSHTRYTVEAEKNGLCLVAAVPLTGRTHQLRVHFSHIGCPLAGDELYGGSRQRRCTAPGWNSPNRVLKRRWWWKVRFRRICRA